MPEIFTGTITAPGLYPDVPEDVYHRDCVPGGSLSVTSAKLLLPPNCPAIFDYHRSHPKPSSKAMNLGTVVHGLVLGTGAEVVEIKFPDWRTKAAQAERDNAVDHGLIPMLSKDYAEAQAIAKAVKEHPVAGGLFAEGDAEVSGFWQDPDTGIWLRMRMDWNTRFGDWPTIVDFKTTADVSPEHFAKSVHEFGYFRQDPWYREGLAAALGCDADDVDFVFVVVPTAPPYIVMVYRLRPGDVDLGREQNKIAREVYRDCTKAGLWPTWDEDIHELALPGWSKRRIEDDINEWHGISNDYF